MNKTLILITIMITITACENGRFDVTSHPLHNEWLGQDCVITEYETENDQSPIYKRHALRFIESSKNRLSVDFSLYSDDQCEEAISFIIGEWEQVFFYRWQDAGPNQITISKTLHPSDEGGEKNEVIYKITNDQLCLGDNFRIDDSATFPQAIINKRSGTLSQDCYTLAAQSQ